MADRYWVGGTANWDGTAGTKWSTTSGGPGGASVPTSADDVFFDANSGAVTVTVSSGTVQCRSVNFTGFTGTFTGTSTLRLVTDFNLSATTNYTFTGTITWNLASGTGVITTNGKTLNNPINIGATGSLSYTVSLADNLTNLSGLTVQRGTFNTNNYSLSLSSLSANATEARTINLGSSTVNLSATGDAFTFNTTTNLTFNAGTSQINLTGANINLIASTTGPGLTFNNLAFTNSGGTNKTINANLCTFNNISLIGPASVGVMNYFIAGNTTINGTLSTTGTAGNRRVWIQSNSYGLRRTLTVNSAPSLTDADFRDIIVNGTSAPISGTRIGNRGACAGITFDAPKTVYWNLAGGGLWSATAWALSSGGTVSDDNFPLPQDTSIIDNTGLNTSATITFNANIPFTGSVDMSTRTNAMTLSFANTGITCYGSWTNGSGTSFGSGLGNGPTFSGEGSKTITSAGKFFPGGVTIDAYGGTVTLNDAIRANGSGAFGQFIVTNGTFDTAGYSLTSANLSSNNSNVRAIFLRNSLVTLTWNQNAISFGTGTNLIFDAGTSTVRHNAAGGSGTYFETSGQTFWNVEHTNVNPNNSLPVTFSGNIVINNNLTFTTISNNGLGRIQLNGNVIVNGTLTLSGQSATSRAFIYSNTLGTPRTLTVNAWSASPADIDFRDITIAGTVGTLSGTRFGDCGGNSGINFPAPKTVYWNLNGSQSWNSTGWALSSGGTPAVNNFPLAQDTAVIDNASAGSSITNAQTYNVGTIDFSNRTLPFSYSIASATPIVYGNFIMGSGVTYSGNFSPTLVFSGRGNQTYTSAGKTTPSPVEINKPSGDFILGDALNVTFSITLTRGTFDAVTYNVTCNIFESNNSNQRTLKMGSGLWTITGTPTAWQIGSTNLTFIKGTANILLSDNTTTARTFAGGGLSYNKLTIGGNTSTSTTAITGNNQFTELASTKTVAHTIGLGTTTQTFGAWTVTGSAGNVVTLTGTGVNHQIAGAATSGIDYLAMGSIGFTQFSPGEFYAGANSTGTAGGATFRTVPPTPRTLYWVGGTGNWSDTARWSLSSGGAGGQAIPTSLDNVIFDSASNATAYTVTIDITSRCNQLTIAGPASGNLTLAGSGQFTAHGNVTLPATGLTRTYNGAIILSGSTTGKTITTNGVILNSGININGVGCEWSLGSALTISSNGMSVTNGSFNTGNFNLNIGGIGSTNSNTREINFGSSTVTLDQSGTAINFSNSINLTFTSGTSLINLTNSSSSIDGGVGQTFNNVSFTNTSFGVRSINGPNTFNNLTLAGNVGGLTQLSINANQTITGTLTCSGSSAIARGFVRSDTIGATRTLTVGTLAANDCDFRDITIAGVAAGTAPTRAGDCGGNSGITFPAPKTVYWNITGALYGWDTNAWATTPSGTPALVNFPLPQDTAAFTNSGTLGQVNSASLLYNFPAIDMSARTTAMTLNVGASMTNYGSFTVGSGVTISGGGTVTFSGRGTMTFTSASKTITFPITVDTPTGTFQLGDALLTQATVTLVRGTFSAGPYNVTISTSLQSFNSNNSNVRTINMGSGTWSSHAGWFLTTPTNCTLNKETANINITQSGSGQVEFNGGGFTYNNVNFTSGGGGRITVTGNNTFNEFRVSTNSRPLLEFGSTTQRIGSLVLNNGTNVTSITGTGSTFIYTGTDRIKDLDYLNVQGRVFGPNGEISDKWYAGPNSVNSGSLGWEFRSYASPAVPSVGNFFMLFI